jgi:signal transduction histidine kinase
MDGRSTLPQLLRRRARRYEKALIVVAVLALTVAPLLANREPRTLAHWVGGFCTAVGALGLALWRQYPVAVLIAGPALILVSTVTGPDPSNFLLPVLGAYAALATAHCSGRAAWAAGLGCAAAVLYLYAITGQWDSPGLLMLTAPGFLAGTALRLRRETAEQLTLRGRELEAERELFADVSVHNERARIASELHDIVGHALTVMVVQAAAGQRLAPRSPEAAAETLSVIAESAHQGRADLQRLIDLLTGTDVVNPDLSLIGEMVDQAARSGLQVTCRLEGSRDGLGSDVAHAAFRVVQESLTNALRHAPGAEVSVLVRTGAGGRAVTVRVENERAPEHCLPRSGAVSGTGRGLIGLRERVLNLGGTFSAGPAPAGGWAVEAQLASGR